MITDHKLEWTDFCEMFWNVPQTLYPLMRSISCCMAELVSSTERRTFTAAYKELSSGAIATRLRATAGPPTYRNPLEGKLGVNFRTPKEDTQTVLDKKKSSYKKRNFSNDFTKMSNQGSSYCTSCSTQMVADVSSEKNGGGLISRCYPHLQSHG